MKFGLETYSVFTVLDMKEDVIVTEQDYNSCNWNNWAKHDVEIRRWVCSVPQAT